MKIIDGQIHLWLPNTPERPWPPGAVSTHGDPYLAEMAIDLMDKSGVRGAVLVPPGWMGTDNSYVLEAAAKYPTRFVVMGRFNYDAPDALDQLDNWRKQPGTVGIRVTLTDPRALGVFKESSRAWFFERCEALDLPLMCYMPNQVAAIGPVARRYPKLRIVVDHAGRYAQSAKDEAAWLDIADLLALADMPNVAVKMSSLPSFSTQPFPFPNLHRPIRAIYDAFGAQRMIFGSDVTRLTSTYDENIRLFSQALDFLSGSDKEWIFSRTLEKWCDVRL